MQLNQSNAEKLISDLGMKDLPIIEIHPTPTSLPSDWFPRYKELCKKFMMSLTDSADTLAFMDLSQDEFMDLIMGQSVPPNISFRFRIPLVWGGKMTPDNMFMCKTFPHSHNMDRFIISQTGASSIWLPAPVKKIYLPANTAGGGDGGNGTEDRLTETAAFHIASSRDI